jgi:dissimilatory sulfite reductase (desulfoviridin) alpha/beta subunit
MASKRGMRRRRCVGKKRYRTACEAACDAAALRRKQGRSDIDVYQCPHCGGIHVGHRPRVVAPSPTPGGKGRWDRA